MSDAPDTDPEGLEEDTVPPELADDAPAPAVVVNPRPADPVAPEADPLSPELVTFDFVEYFLEITEGLMRHVATAEVRRDMGQPTPQVTVHAIEDGLGGALSPVLKSLYAVADHGSFSWHIANAPRVAGSLELISFSRVFGRWFDTLWAERPGADEPEVDFHWSLRGFDLPPHDDALQVVIEVAPDDPSRHALWVHHPDHHPLPLSLGVVDYLYCALEARAIHRWQLLFTPYDHAADPWGLGDTLAWLDDLATYFPEADLSFFHGQLDAKQHLIHEEE